MLLPQSEVATALESFFRVGATGGGKTNDRFDALMQARPCWLRMSAHSLLSISCGQADVATVHWLPARVATGLAVPQSSQPCQPVAHRLILHLPCRR